MLKNLWFMYPGRILGTVEALLALGLAFGLNLSAEQTAAIVAATASVLGLFSDKALVSRTALDALASDGGV